MHRDLVRIIFLFGLATVFYSNCAAPNSDSGGDSAFTALTFSNCEEDFMNLFANGYHPFLQTNCVNCHVSGPGKGTFASPDINVAYAAFQQIGYDNISNHAVSQSHNPPYTGPQHQQTIADLRLQWSRHESEKAECKAGTPPPGTIDFQTLKLVESKAIAMPATLAAVDLSKGLTEIEKGKKTVTFDLSKDMLDSSLGFNGQLTLRVGIIRTATGDATYTISEPRIFGNTTDLHVKGLFVKLNNQFIRYATTFDYLDVGIPKNTIQANGLLSTGSMVVAGNVTPATDIISFGFIVMEKTTLPPPAPPPEITIAGSKAVLTPKGDYKFDIVLNAPNPTDPVRVTLSLAETPPCTEKSKCPMEIVQVLCPSGTCDPNIFAFSAMRSVVGVKHNRFDWDYKYNNEPITFMPGEIKKTVTIKFSSDIRLEANRVLTLNLQNPLSAKLGSQSSVYLVVNKMGNPVPSSDVPTFSQLMNESTGILGSVCVKCHNSVDRAGGYDMTDYEEMLARRVLVPGDSSSKMFSRMNADDPNLLGLTPMPLTGFLEDPLINKVKQWILDGAKNN